MVKQDCKHPENIIGEFDESLKYVKKLQPSSLWVYQVQREGQDLVLKVGLAEFPFCTEHLAQEAEILKKLRGLPGIPKLDKSYSSRGIYAGALLKEFFEGLTLRDSGISISRSQLQRQLESTVRAIHEAGFANLDIRKHNVVVSPDRKDICLIDLGTAICRDTSWEHTFEYLRDVDLRLLKQLGEFN
jgi:serine/threonine protein kinase